MQIHYRMNDKTITLIITDLAPQYHQAAQDTGYTLTNEGFVRDLVANTAAYQPDYLDQIINNCQHSMEPLLAQKAGLQPVLWEKALLTFLALVDGQGVDWWLVGSAALAVRGIDIQPGDIDLCTGESDALTLQDLLIDYVIQPVQESTGWIGKWFGRAFLGAKLEWLGGVHDSVDAWRISDFGPAAHARLETIDWHGYAIRVPPLELQLEVCERRGLVDRTNKIRKALHQTT